MATAIISEKRSVQDAVLRATRWRRQELDAAKSLGLECHPLFHGIAKELAALRETRPDLTTTYEEGIMFYLKKEAKTCLDWRGSLSLFKDAPGYGREAVYDKLGITCAPLDDVQTKNFGVSHLYNFGELFDMIVHGSALERIKDLEGMSEPSTRITRRWGSNGAYCISLEEKGKRAVYFLKDGSMEPDYFGAKLLEIAGILTPQIINVLYPVPFSGEHEYGISRNIAAERGVKRAPSHRALARDEILEPIVSSEPRETAYLLGYSSEAYRLTGEQDKRARNTGMAQMDNEERKAWAIDLDITAVYPDTPSLQASCARALNDNVKSLLFAYDFGEIVRAAPELIKDVLKSEYPGCGKRAAEKRRVRKRAEFLKNNYAPFIEGANRARELYDSPEATMRVYELFREHDGKAVGWKQKPDELKRDSEGYCLTTNAINGQRQPLIEGGPNCGRFVFRWEGAFRNFLTQLSIRSRDFWHDVLRAAPSKTDHAIAY